MRREYPDLATREAADDDDEIFGEAWPLVVEWRALKDAHPNEGNGLDWLTAQERLLVVELALLEDHGMTLPPEKQPLKVTPHTYRRVGNLVRDPLGIGDDDAGGLEQTLSRAPHCNIMVEAGIIQEVPAR